MVHRSWHSLQRPEVPVLHCSPLGWRDTLLGLLEILVEPSYAQEFREGARVGN